MNSAACVIRPATPVDLDAVCALLRETWHQVYDPIIGENAVDEISARWHAPVLLDHQLRQRHASFIVACAGELVIGHGFAFVRDDPATLVVSRLYVRPSHQRQGVGRSLLAALCARHKEARTLCLFVAAENRRGLSFYRREGFTVAREGLEEGVRVLHMEKPLG
jgi:ribosomal protein S18 acetylase RimI-like enzyme